MSRVDRGRERGAALATAGIERGFAASPRPLAGCGLLDTLSKSPHAGIPAAGVRIAAFPRAAAIGDLRSTRANRGVPRVPSPPAALWHDP